ncbi:peptidoglycan-binding domain-containing protein [Halocynthiibacter sp. C4]|uniref:peptidoglycan-binding domain-containing protein n=1 Tax=Halocynthiibacter sp. C4 TaxID=2992758 RepID=UPI00237BBD1F|nr:peptidoglycan-binding domain-containing protein [Halocynthiibacter sp. C4]MDE0590092.1 peptidoglycan-binding domain-containing protein [Halocynthiibacter sp. C4]
MFSFRALSCRCAVLSFATVSVMAAQMQPAKADFGEALVAGVINGLVSEAFEQQDQTTTSTQQATVKKKVPASPEVQENMDLQRALNHFGFAAGHPDGVLGKKSRAAMAQVQSDLGYPVTGQFDDYERAFMLRSYDRAMANPEEAKQIAATSPLGMRAVLVEYQILEEARMTPDNPDALVEGDGAAEFPDLFGDAGEGDIALSTYCDEVGARSFDSSGPVLSQQNADMLLAEQFCFVRVPAIEDGAQAAASIAGLTDAQIEQECMGLVPAMNDLSIAVSMQSMDEVLVATHEWTQSTGASEEQLSTTGKICLSVGYDIDNMDVALSAALLLAAVDNPAYAELVGHHLSQGFGATMRPELAIDWYESAAQSVAAGGEEVFLSENILRLMQIYMAGQVLAANLGG